MDAIEALDRFAELERRALELYRRFAALYAGIPELAALWRQMSDIEAAHFATLSIVGDLVRMDPGRSALPPIPEQNFMATQKILDDAELVADSGLPPGEVAQLGLALESSEIPRIVELLDWLPARARTSVSSGIVAGLQSHLECLERIATVSGRADVAEKARALRLTARRIAERRS